MVTVRVYIIKILLIFTIFDYIFYTAGPFATKLGLIVQHNKLECPVGNWDYCVQGQGHTEGYKCQ